MSLTNKLLLLAVLPLASAQQQYIISTVAGLGTQPFAGNNGPAANARLINPQYVAADAAGNVYAIDVYYQQVFRISPAGTITVFAGTGTAGFSGDNGPAAAAQLSNPLGLAIDAAGNVFIEDNGNGRVRKVTPAGVISTVALLGGRSVSVDAAGNLYVCQTLGNTVSKLTPDGKIATFAGTGQAGSGGDQGQAASAQLNGPTSTKVDAAGNVYIVDTGNNKIRKVTPQGVISTFAGTGKFGFAGDGQAAINASLLDPLDVVFGAGGSVYIADNGNVRVRVVNAAGVISTYAGGTSTLVGTIVGDGPPAQVSFAAPVALAVDNAGNLLLADEGLGQVRRVSATAVTTVAGLPPTVEQADNGPATSAALIGPFGVAVDPAGAVYVSDPPEHRIRKISPAGIITTFAGNGLGGNSPDGSPVTQVGNPQTLAFDLTGNLFFTTGSTLRRIAPDGTVLTLAGSVPGFSGDKGLAVPALLASPTGIVADPAGNIYIADTNNNRVRRIDFATKTINTIAGTGDPTYSGDNGPATAAALYHPNHLGMDGNGNLYIADSGNQRIRKITPDGVITTVAGNGGQGDAGEGGPAIAAQLLTPGGLAVDAAGDIFIADMFGSRIRMVTAATGTIATIAGTGRAAFSGDGGFATSAMINGPVTLAVDRSGNVFFTDATNRRVRKLTPAQLTSSGVLNAASLLPGAVAAGEIVVINGSNLNADGSTQVMFDGNPAAVVSVQANQVTAIVPYAVDGQKTTQLQLVGTGSKTNALALPVAATAPGIFTQDSSGAGAGQIANADSSPNSPSNPAAAGDVVTISATGEGQTNPAGVDGQPDPDPAPMPVAAVSVQIGGMDAPIVSAGGIPGTTAGYFQVSVQIPAGVATGDAIPIVLTVGGVGSQSGVSISIH